MKKLCTPLLFGVAILLASCSSDDDGNNNDNQTANFTVTIENVVTPKPIFQSGVFSTPIGATAPAPIFPGDSYQFDIDAGPVVVPMDGGTRLSFVTMFVQSNDLFFAPGEQGIALYNLNGIAIGANGPQDVTGQVLLWDAGTEVNEITGGPNQKPQQSMTAEDQGMNENGVVTQITNNTDVFGNVIPNVNAVIKVTIENIAPAKFRVKIMNVSTSTTIATPGLGVGTTAAVPMSPGVYAVHTGTAPFFMAGASATGAGSVGSNTGVEDIAEDGFPEALAMDTTNATGLIVPLSPGAYAVHTQGTQPMYQINTPDFGEGLEGIAEDGTPMALVTSLSGKTSVSSAAAFNMPVGASAPGPIGPGGSYQFSFTASEGENLSLSTMFIQSNDWFYAFSPDGLPLFSNGMPVMGDVTSQVFLYDVGTEADEYPGAGLFQVIRQPGLNTGAADSNSNVRLITPSSQMMNVPATANTIRVTITAQ